MKVLLDTHAFLWAAAEPSRLSVRATEVCKSEELLLSVVSLWEIALKVQIGKLELPGNPQTYISRQLMIGRISVLPILARHAFRIGELPMNHRDPFDRMLAAQSLEEKIPLVTCDPLFLLYNVETLW